jgi:hypothetical protein
MGELVELDVTTVEESVTVNVTEEGQVDIAVFAEKGDTGPAGPAGPNSVTSATTSDGTASLNVLSVTVSDDDGFIYTSGENATISTSGANAYILTDGAFASIRTTGLDADIFTNGDNASIYTNGADASIITNGANAYIYTVGLNGTIFTLGDSAHIYTSSPTAYIQTGSTFRLFDGTYATTLSHSPTADNAIAFPNRSGSVALTEDYTAGTATIDVLNATVQGTLTAAHIHGNVAGSVYAHVRAGENLAKGDPVYVSGSHGTGANLIAVVSKADASNAAKMPAVGVMDAAVSNNANGHMVITGTISDLDTNAYAVNTVLYVASGGGWTSTPPAANSQPVAIVERSNTNNGAVIVKVNGLASSGGNGASDANKLVRYPSSGSTGSGAIVQATLPTLTSPTLTGTPNFTATNYTFASDARIGFLNSLSSQFVYKNGTIPFAEIFEDFPVTTGTHGFISAGGTVAYYAPSSTNAARYWGALSLTTGATTDNTAIITLAPSGGANGQTTSRFELSHQVCFCVNNATSSEFRARLQGSGQTFDCAVLFGTGVVQLEATNIGGAGVNSVSVATGLTLAAGDFISGTRYRLFVRCISATQTEVYFASAPWNSSTWTTLADTTVTHSSITLANVSSQPVYFVTTKTNAARIAYIDWVAIRYAIQR